MIYTLKKKKLRFSFGKIGPDLRIRELLENLGVKLQYRVSSVNVAATFIFLNQIVNSMCSTLHKCVSLWLLLKGCDLFNIEFSKQAHNLPSRKCSKGFSTTELKMVFVYFLPHFPWYFFYLTKYRGIRKSKSQLHIEAQIQRGGKNLNKGFSGSLKVMAIEINVKKYYRCIFNIVVFIAPFIKVNQLETEWINSSQNIS